MSTPFFIVGSGRSGSTLLRVILCAHSQVVIPPETYFIMPLLEQLPPGVPLTAAQVTAAQEIITGHYRWPDMGLPETEFTAAVTRLERPSLQDILNVIYDFHLDQEGKTIWGDKTPPYVSIVPGLLSLYPDARIIHLVRDGRDVAKSFQSTGWYGPLLYKNTGEWKGAIRSIHDCQRNHPEIGIYEVRYEDLVLDTEETIHALCRHLDLAFEPGMLDWADGLATKIPEREAHIHRKLRRKPQAKDVERWKHEMTRREILVTESYISHELESAGYALYFRSLAWRPLFLACRVVLPVYSLMARIYGFVRRRILGNNR